MSNSTNDSQKMSECVSSSESRFLENQGTVVLARIFVTGPVFDSLGKSIFNKNLHFLWFQKSTDLLIEERDELWERVCTGNYTFFFDIFL